jgi:membrane associated rhomboid family serine protease
MASIRGTQTSLFGSSQLGPAVRGLLIAIAGLWVGNFVLSLVLNNDHLLNWIELRPSWVVEKLALWQLVTYAFVHPLQSPLMLAFNLFNLWMFGRELESLWGTKRFLQYFFLCVVAAAVSAVVLSYALSRPGLTIVGASGPILGLILAFGYLFPELPVMFFGILPMKMKWLAGLMIGLALLMGGEFAFAGALGAGFLWMRNEGMSAATPAGRSRRPGQTLSARLQEWYKDYKFQRNKKKFEDYMRKQDRERFH